MEQTISNANVNENKTVEKKRGVRKRKLKRTIFITAMLAYPILQFLLFWFYVNINTFVLSFQTFSYAKGDYIWCGFKNYIDLFQLMGSNDLNGKVLRQTIVNSLILFPFNNFILLPVSVICAYILFKKVFMHSVFRIIFFLPSIISIVVLTMVFTFMFDSTFGPVDSILRMLHMEFLIPPNGWLGTKGLSFNMIMVYCLWAGIGYNVVLITGAIIRVPVEIFEAGKIDGIGMWRELVSVVIPLIFATISTMFVMGSTVIFTLFLQPKLITSGGPNGSSQTISYYVMQLVENNKLEKAASTGIFFSIIGVPFILGVKWIFDRLTPDVEF